MKAREGRHVDHCPAPGTGRSGSARDGFCTSRSRPRGGGPGATLAAGRRRARWSRVHSPIARRNRVDQHWLEPKPRSFAIRTIASSDAASRSPATGPRPLGCCVGVGVGHPCGPDPLLVRAAPSGVEEEPGAGAGAGGRADVRTAHLTRLPRSGDSHIPVPQVDVPTVAGVGVDHPVGSAVESIGGGAGDGAISRRTVHRNGPAGRRHRAHLPNPGWRAARAQRARRAHRTSSTGGR